MIPQSKAEDLRAQKALIKVNYIYLPLKILAGLELEISQILNLSFYH
jgi:hypothetical protein